MGNKKYSGILVFAEQKKGVIHKVSYELLNKASELAGDLECKVYSVLLTADDSEAEELIYHGSDEVIVIEDSGFDYPDERFYKNNIVSVIEKINPEIVLIGATTFGRALAPRIASAMGIGLTADCTDLKIDDDSKLIQIRPAFSGNILAHIKSDKYPQMATIRYKEFLESERDEENIGEIVKDEVVKKDGYEKIKELEKNQIDITEAEVVVSGGKGLKNPSDFELLQELADVLGGVVGASRDVVDAGFIGHDHQVGYSGARVKPKLYIACGISGATQHLVGMRESDIIIAINKDPSAPIFSVADYGIIGDLYKIVPKMIEKFSS